MRRLADSLRHPLVQDEVWGGLPPWGRAAQPPLPLPLLQRSREGALALALLPPLAAALSFHPLLAVPLHLLRVELQRAVVRQCVKQRWRGRMGHD